VSHSGDNVKGLADDSIAAAALNCIFFVYVVPALVLAVRVKVR
jgi:hypothetical protein